MWKNILLHCIFINRVAVHGNKDTNLILSDNNDEAETISFNSIANCIIAISDQELYFRPTVAILKQTRNGTKDNAFTNELIDKLTEHNIPQLILNDILNEEYHDLHIHGLTVAFISRCGDVSNFDLKRIDKDMKFLIIILDTSHSDCVKKLKQIGNLVSRNAVTFIIQDFQTDKNKMFTMIPKIDVDTCKEIVETPTHINTCSNGTIQNEEIFPLKNPENLNKCPLRVGMATLFPFSTIVNKESLKDYDHVEEIKGSDFEIMKIFNGYFNATLDIHYISRSEENPYGNTGFLEFVLNGSLDACAGGLYRIYGDVVEYTGSYVRQGVFWIYYAERPDRSWESLVSKLNDVYFFFIFYVTYSLVWYFISLFDGDTVSLVSTLLSAWGALVDATLLQDARSNKQKFINFLYLIICIFSSAYISIQFYSFLTIRPPPHLLRTNDDIMKSGMISYLKNSSKYFMADEKYSKFVKTAEDCVSFHECAEKALKYKGLTVFLQGHFYRFQAASAVNGEARVLRATENLMTVYHYMLIRKNSSLVAKFQIVMQRLFETGVTSRLFTKALGLSWVARAASANTKMISSSYSCQAGCAITLTQFAGIFYAWIIGCVISCLVFVIELFMKREQRLEFVN